MAEKISVQIALAGGAEIEQQLAAIGEAGTKAFQEISKSAEQVGGFKNLDPTEVTEKLKALGINGSAALEKIRSAVQSTGRLESLVQGVAAVEAGFAKVAQAAVAIAPAVVGAAGLIATALGYVVTSTIETANAIGKVAAEAQNLGLTIEKFDQLRAGMENAGISAKAISAGLAQVKSDADKLKLDQIAKAFEVLKSAGPGTTFAELGKSFRVLTEEAAHFTPAGKAAAEALQKLGLPIPGTTVEDVRTLGTELAKLKGLGFDIKIGGDAATQMQAIIAGLRQMPDSAQRTEIAIQRLGRVAGPEFVAALRTGSIAAIDEVIARHGLLTQETENTASEVEQAINRLIAAWNRFSSLTFAPQIIAGLNLVTNAITTLNAAMASISWETFSNAAVAALNLVSAAANKIGLSGFSAVTAAIASIPWGSLGAAGVAAWNAIVGAVQNAASWISRFVVALVSVTWGDIASAGVAAWNAIVSAVQAAGSAIAGFVASLPGITWDAISGAGVAAWDALAAAIQRVMDKIKVYLGLKPSAPATEGGGGGGFARGGWVGGRGSGTSDSNLAWVSRGEHIMPARVVRQPGVLGLLESLRRGGGIPGYAAGGVVGGSGIATVIDKAIGALERIIQSNNAAHNAAAQDLTGVVRAVDSAMQNLTNNMMGTGALIQQAAAMLEELKRAAGNARGGLLGGRGSGTSDSNLAWLSRGEYITPARAVRQPGVLAFLEALRRSGGNLRAVLDGMGRFALGGMVPRPMPALAAARLTGGMSNVTIQFPGLPAIGGLRAPAVVVDELRQAAALAQVRSGGRKPSRYS